MRAFLSYHTEAKLVAAPVADLLGKLVAPHSWRTRTSKFRKTRTSRRAAFAKTTR